MILDVNILPERVSDRNKRNVNLSRQFASVAVPHNHCVSIDLARRILENICDQVIYESDCSSIVRHSQHDSLQAVEPRIEFPKSHVRTQVPSWCCEVKHLRRDLLTTWGVPGCCDVTSDRRLCSILGHCQVTAIVP